MQSRARKFFAALRTVAVVVGVTLALDFAVTLFIPAKLLDSWLAARERDAAVYDRTVAWHHEIRPNLDLERLWGATRYRFRSDAHGHRTGACAGDVDAPLFQGRTVFVAGDSFAEGLGVAFEASVAGLLACAYREAGFSVRNLGTQTYSPVIYHHRIADAVRRTGVRPSEIVLFLDLSDIHNDANDYVEIGGRVLNEPPSVGRRSKDFLKRNFTSIAVAFELRQRYAVEHASPIAVSGNPLARWTVDPALQQAWARRGLEVAGRNLDRLVALCREWGCRLTLVVYPWPDQLFAGDRESLQVTHWRDWSAARDVRFVDAFAPFFERPAEQAVREWYIKRDIHFNDAGHRHLFEAVWSQIKP
ncbi:MAG: SGNH/GDSL hydrolase family protein [Alphaproteobacteria bacterium]|nr:SGNH/GDSL hydrolase family protein [Alphaproteobacteria bacterium]